MVGDGGWVSSIVIDRFTVIDLKLYFNFMLAFNLRISSFAGDII